MAWTVLGFCLEGPMFGKIIRPRLGDPSRDGTVWLQGEFQNDMKHGPGRLRDWRHMVGAWWMTGDWLVFCCAKSIMNLGVVTKQQKPTVAPFQRAPRYCGWKKSCTTLDVRKPLNSEINYLSTGMLSLQIYRSHIWSTCWYWKSDVVRRSMKVKNSVAIAVKPTTISGTIVLELRTMILINHIWLVVWNMNFIFHNIW